MTGKQLIYLLYSLSLIIVLSYGCQTPIEEESMGGEVMAGDNAGEVPAAGEQHAEDRRVARVFLLSDFKLVAPRLGFVLL